MKIGIIGIGNIRYMPFITKYTDLLEHNGMNYSIITWDRNMEEHSGISNTLFYKKYSPIHSSKVKKGIDYIGYYYYLKKILREKNFDKLIILTSLAGVMLNGELAKEYKQRYVFDIRDYTYEFIPIYKYMMNSLVRNSAFSVISSKAYINWLPLSDKYVMSHNIDSDFMKRAVQINDKLLPWENEKIRISFLGMIRYYEENLKLIKALANHDRFELHFIGEGLCEKELKIKCEKDKIANVQFKGKYAPNEKVDLYRNTDFVNCLCGTNNTQVTTAIGNRMYDSCALRKPILVTKGSYMGNIVSDYGLGLDLDLSRDNVSKLLLDYIDNFDRQVYDENCVTFLQQVKTDEDMFGKSLQEFLLN